MPELTARQKAHSCFHFNGIQHDTCRGGISYGLLRQQHNGLATLPCIPRYAARKGVAVAFCAAFRYPTEAELDEEERESATAVTAYLTALHANLCSTCGQSTEPRRQVGRRVYGACGHRLYQGKVGDFHA